MNDKELRQYEAIAVQEPHARMIDGQVVTNPMGHSNWTKFIPTHARDGRWPVRSMLWIRKDIDAEQIPMDSADLTGVFLRLPDRDVIMVSVYVEGRHAEALETAIKHIDDVIMQHRGSRGRRTDAILVCARSWLETLTDTMNSGVDLTCPQTGKGKLSRSLT